jgi:hypothetical protein
VTDNFSDSGRIVELLDGIRPEDYKVERISGAGAGQNDIDLILTEEELSFLKISMSITYSWLQEYKYAQAQSN